jgi:hypothetical protein
MIPGLCSSRSADSTSGVSTNPGHNAVTVTPVPASSIDNDSVKLNTNALLAPYTASHGVGWNAATEATLRIRPCPRSTIGSAKSRIMAATAPTLSLMSPSSSSRRSSTKRRNNATPALFTSTSTWIPRRRKVA